MDILNQEQVGGMEQVAGLEKATGLAEYLSLLGLSIIFPFFHFQLVTGPLVNAILFIAVIVLGLRSAISIAFLPSIVAYSVGLLPAVLGPMIPFIMLGNIVLCVVFHYLWRKNYWLGVGAASCAKFILLFGMSRLLFDLILKQNLSQAVATMMSWPQLYSAIVGGIIAFVFLKFVKRI